MKKILTLLLFLSLSTFIFSEEAKPKFTGAELLEMPESQAFNSIAKLTKEEAAELITQIRSQYRKDNPEIDKFYLLISHLEAIKSIEEEQARLKSLNLVYAMGLALLLGLLGYILYSQRRTIQNLNQLLK
jgi:hypothetical protein